MQVSQKNFLKDSVSSKKNAEEGAFYEHDNRESDPFQPCSIVLLIQSKRMP